ncbi:MAG: hypothetical protein QXE05_04280 [Nitrososphaeria archaeon]
MPGSPPISSLTSSNDLKVKINTKDFVSLTNKFNISTEKNELHVQSLEVYNRLLKYIRVRPSLKENIKSICELEEQINSMISWNVYYRVLASENFSGSFGRSMEKHKPSDFYESVQTLFEI